MTVAPSPDQWRVPIRTERGTLDFRFAVDPLHSVRAALIGVFGFLPSSLPGSYKSAMRAAARSARIDMTALAPQLLPMPSSGYPRFLYDLPQAGVAALEDQLERMRECSPEDIQAELHRTFGAAPLPAVYRPWADRPAANLHRYVTALEQFADKVVRPVIPSFDRRLQIDTERWAAMDSMGSADRTAALLAQGHAQLQLLDGALTVPAPPSEDLDDSRTLLVCPMLGSLTTFTTGVSLDQQGRRARFLCLTTPGLAVRVMAPKPCPSDLSGLDGLLGPSRTSLIRALHQRPATTTQLAAELGMAPSTISHHLKHLARSGAVFSTQQIDGGVLYALSSLGEGLLDLYRRHER